MRDGGDRGGDVVGDGDLGGDLGGDLERDLGFLGPFAVAGATLLPVTALVF